MKIITLAFTLLSIISINAQNQKPIDVVKASLVAYNNTDIDLFMSYFSEDVVMKDYHNGKVNATGIDEVRAIFEPYFKASPDLHSKIVDRIVF